MQAQHEHAAASNHALLASANHGQPPIAATGRPGEFSGRNVVAAHGAANERAEERPAPRQENVRANAQPRAEERPAARPENAGANAHPNNSRPQQPRAENHPAPKNQPKDKNNGREERH
jgi:hypothetical protein